MLWHKFSLTRKMVTICIGTLIMTSETCKDNSDRILPKRMSLTQSIYSSAIVQPDSLYQAFSSVSGILYQNYVEEGAAVQKGQKICEIENTFSLLNTEGAKLGLDLAKEKYDGQTTLLTNLSDEINAATFKFKNDSINYFRQKRLWEQQIGSENQFEQYQLNYKLSKNNLKMLQDNYARTKNELDIAVKQAQNLYHTSIDRFKDYTIRSQINGTVYALYKEPGELVNTVEPLAAIGSSTDFVVELLVDEVDIVDVKLDQEIVLRLDAYKDSIFIGRVSKIYPFKQQSNLSFKVESKFTKQPNVLYPGLSGEANIIIKTKENALTLPKEYLIEKNKVLTEKGTVQITIGLESIDLVEVVDGLDEQTYVLKPQL